MLLQILSQITEPEGHTWEEESWYLLQACLPWLYASAALELACEGCSLLCLLDGGEVRLRGPTLPMLSPLEYKGTRVPLALGNPAPGSALSMGVILPVIVLEPCRTCIRMNAT